MSARRDVDRVEYIYLETTTSNVVLVGVLITHNKVVSDSAKKCRLNSTRFLRVSSSEYIYYRLLTVWTEIVGELIDFRKTPVVEFGDKPRRRVPKVSTPYDPLVIENGGITGPYDKEGSG